MHVVGFRREEMMAWCEASNVDSLFGLARNQRLSRIVGVHIQQARVLPQTTGKAVHAFTGFAHITRKSWSRTPRGGQSRVSRRGENPLARHFAVFGVVARPTPLRNVLLRSREMKNPIKEEMCLFADRLATDEMKGNQLRLPFSALANTRIEALRLMGLKGTE